MNKSSFDAKRMSTLALLIAVAVVMSFTPLGYLVIGPLSMSLIDDSRCHWSYCDGTC